MTPNEERCFATIKSWKRKAICRRLRYRVFTILRDTNIFDHTSISMHVIYILLLLVLSPLIILLWLIRAITGLICFPFEYFKTLSRLKNLRSPGERNIQGIHHAFSKHFDLPVDLYLNCVDDWIHILYPEKADDKELSIKQHIDPQIINYKEDMVPRDNHFHDYAKSQVSRAREEISKELGFYR